VVSRNPSSLGFVLYEYEIYLAN